MAAAGPLPGTELSVEAAGASVAAGASTGAGALVGAAGGALAGDEASPAEVGAATISAPRPVDGPLPVESVAGPSTTGPPESFTAPAALLSLSPGFCAATVNTGPGAPGFKTSVAETRSSGGFRFGSPERAATETSGRDSTIPRGNFATRLSR